MSRAALRTWFDHHHWKPFDFQRDTWRAQLAGESGLVHAPTGFGKTYSVWMGPVARYLRDRRISATEVERQLSAGRAADEAKSTKPIKQRRARTEPLRVLWLTPLRALANDTYKALHLPIDELCLPWSVELRTGDTSSYRKTKQRERLPTALITTPESLSLMLSYEDAQEKFRTLQTVIVDEWHELLSTKRGVQTELALARLRNWNPDLQTWGLSATLGNLEQARDALVGVNPSKPPRLIQGKFRKPVEIETLIPDDIERFPWAGHLGMKLVDDVIARIESARSTLFFTNTRSQAEIWFRGILSRRHDLVGEIALHHGSLERDIRTRVEAALREGRLRAVVCTSSLDLGVDFSPVDQVIQIGSPKGIARLMQRAGRSGHQPGALSRIVCVPTHAFELIEFAAAREGVLRRDVEPREPLDKPLDVLAQHLVTCAAGGGFDPERLFDEVRSAYAYRDLTRQEFDWTFDFVKRGGPALTAYPDYARVRRDPATDNMYRIASPRLGRTHRLNIGTITGETAMKVRYTSGKTLGTIEESFIARLTPGDTFVFAGQVLELVRVREMVVHVRKARRASGSVPRWNGGRFPLSTQLAEAVRRRIAGAGEHTAPEPEMEAALPLLLLQARWSIIPAADELLIEHVHRDRAGWHWSVFPFAGRQVHEGLSSLLAYRLSKRRPSTINITANDYGFELLSESELLLDEADWRRLFVTDDLTEDLLACLNATQMARRQFRDIARVAGLLMQGYPGQRKTARHLQASSNLFFDVFSEYDPQNLLLDQARREVLDQQLEIRRLRGALERIAQQPMRIVHTPRLTPLSFPLYAERLRAQHVSSERWSDRVKRMAIRLETTADRETRKRRRAAG